MEQKSPQISFSKGCYSIFYFSDDFPVSFCFAICLVVILKVSRRRHRIVHLTIKTTKPIEYLFIDYMTVIETTPTNSSKDECLRHLPEDHIGIVSNKESCIERSLVFVSEILRIPSGYFSLLHTLKPNEPNIRIIKQLQLHY